MNKELLLKIKNYRIPFKEVNQTVLVEYLPIWKEEYVEIEKINEMVARQLLYKISEDLFGGVNEIEFANKSKTPQNHFQMNMHVGEFILWTSPFIYVDNNHKLIAKNTKITILNSDYDDVAFLKENEIKGGKADKITTLDALYDYWAEKGYKSGGISKSLKKQLQQQINKGVKIEMEHTNDKEKATEITMDHLTEFPDYYDRLEKMENKGEKDLKLNETKLFIKQKLRKSLNEQQVKNIVGWRVGSSELNPKMGGIWFAETKEGAENFAKSMRNNNDEAKGYIINMKNPKYFKTFWGDFMSLVTSYLNDREKIMNDLISSGYDGMYIDKDMWNDTGDEFAVFSKQYVVFDKSQIKPI